MLDLFILCTKVSHRGQGVGGELVARAVDAAAADGLVAVYSMGLSSFSQKIFTKMGFEQQVEIVYGDYTQVRLIGQLCHKACPVHP